MNKEKVIGLIKNLSFFIGGITVMVTGLIYVLITDIYLGNTSVYLLSGILFAFAGSICFLLANSFKHKVKVFYILKGIGFVMSIGFIIFLFAYMKTDLYNKATVLKLFKTYNGKTVWFLSKNFQGAMAIPNNIKPIFVTDIIVTIIAVVCQGLNVGLHIIDGVEE